MNLPISFSVSAPSFAALDPQLIQVLLTAALVFIFAVLIGFSRRYFTKSTLRGVWAGFVVGIMSIVILEGMVFWGFKSLATADTQLLPENVRVALTDSQAKISNVLGIETERERPTAQSVVSDYQILTPLDAELVKNSVCRVVEETPPSSGGARE